jgi:hypothetical protein
MDLLTIPLAQFVTHLVSQAFLNLMLAFHAREPSATATCKIENVLKVLELREGHLVVLK